jgi:hypothetical protein
MKMNIPSALAAPDLRKGKVWKAGATILASFAAGSLLTTYLTHMKEVRAENNRVFELMIYHTIPGKAAALESIFRDVSKMQEKYGVHVIGYWVPNEDPAWKDTFVYVVAHPSREEANKNWAALHTDPEFPKYREQAVPLIEKKNGEFNVDEVYMRPSDFSALK